MTVTTELRDNYRGVFNGKLGFGRRPAIVVVDFVRAYTEPGSPLYAPAVVGAVERTVPLLARARQLGHLIVYTQVLYSPSGADGGLFVQKVPVLRSFVPGALTATIVPDLEPGPADVVITKQYASGFFGTSLASTLTSAGVDTIVLTGCSTSGCVRATAVDGMQHGFRVIVPRECVADRAPEPHEANLFDIDAKYGDVVSLAEVMEQL